MNNNKFTIYINQTLVAKTRIKKDGTRQVILKVRIPNLKFQQDLPIFYLNDERNEKLCLNEFDYQSLSKKNTQIIEHNKMLIKEAVKTLRRNNTQITRDTINNLVQNGNIFNASDEIKKENFQKITSYNETLIDTILDDEILEEMKNVVPDNEVLQAEDIGDHYIQAELDLNKKKELERISKIEDAVVRAKAQYKLKDFADFNKIVDVFGFVWTIDKSTGESIATKKAKAVAFRLYDYILNTNASPNIKDFNNDWVDEFLIFVAKNGHVGNPIRNYTPLELKDNKNKILEANTSRKLLAKSSFEDVVKYLTYVIKLIRDYTQLLPNNIKVDRFKPSKYLKNKKLIYTQKDHYINVDELKQILKTDFNDNDLNQTRDLFFIQTFSSGSRSIDKDVTELLKINGIEYIRVNHSKTDSINNVGIAKPLKNIINKNGGTLPIISIKVEDYNSGLKKIAKMLNLNRPIEHFNTATNLEKAELYHLPLNECVSQYFARHTLVNYLVDSEIPDGEIIEITGHVDVRILEHYKVKLSIEKKQKILDKADSQHDW